MMPNQVENPEASAPLRIAIVSRRFWPVSGPTEHFIADLADNFSTSGHQVRVFTAAWQKGWPAECSFREFELRRLSRPGSGPWGTFRYQRALSRELDIYQPDAVLLFGSGEDLLPVRKILGDSVPCVVRIDHRALTRLSKAAQKNLRLDLATAVLGDTQFTRGDMAARNMVLPENVQIVSNGVRYNEEQHDRTLVQQANSRSALGDAHPVLRIDPAQPLVVTGAPMDSDPGICDLVKAWMVVLESFPKGKLWILGDGPRSRKVWDMIADHDIIYSAIMPGYFDDLSDIFQAADLYVHPQHRPVNCHCLLQAISQGVCPLVTDSSIEPVAKRDCEGRISGGSAIIERDATGIIAPAGNPTALGEAITMALRHNQTRAKLGQAAANEFRSAIDLNRIAKVFLDSLRPVDHTKSASGVSLS